MNPKNTTCECGAHFEYHLTIADNMTSSPNSDDLPMPHLSDHINYIIKCEAKNGFEFVELVPHSNIIPVLNEKTGKPTGENKLLQQAFIVTRKRIEKKG